MEFKKYNSIENSYQDDFMQSIIDQGFGDIEYVVQEKVHGANLSFITDGQKIIAAKRTELILDDEQFFNSKSVQDRYRDNILNLFQEISEKFNTKTVTIFGELFGGGYPHPDVAKDDAAKLVQRGIYYCPSNDFFAFDILLDNEKYVDVEIASQLFDKFGFIYAKALFKGSLSDCLTFSNSFKTTLPNDFGLPELEGNICEGVVIRPVQPSFFRTGSRVLIKNKNEMWAENNNYIDKVILSKLLHEGEELSEEASFLCEEIYKYITQNRLDNLISKIGEVHPRKGFGKVLGLYCKDVLTDFLKKFQPHYDALEKHETKVVNKFLNKHAEKLIQTYFDELRKDVVKK
jgi:Rnl2 family RNA ligase